MGRSTRFTAPAEPRAIALGTGGVEGQPAPARPPAFDLSNQLEDAEAAYALIVKRAREWRVDTARLGMIGFSAGAGLTMHATLNSKTMHLAFIGLIYGGMGPVETGSVSGTRTAPAIGGSTASCTGWR